MEKFKKILKIIAQHPGLDSIALKGKGLRPSSHGSLRDAERVGLIEYKNGGWFVTQEPIESTLP